MRAMASTGRRLLILAACISLMGCASFKGNKLQELGAFSPPASDAKKPSATYDFSSTAGLVSASPQPEHIRVKLEAEFVDVLHESGYFTTLEKGTDGKDLAISIHLVNSGTPLALIPAFITGLSLYTIPSWATDNFEAVCSVKAQDGKLHEYRLEDSATLFQWFPMMFAFSSNNPKHVYVEVRKNIYRNLILKMQEDGVLPKAATRPKASRLIINLMVASDELLRPWT